MMVKLHRKAGQFLKGNEMRQKLLQLKEKIYLKEGEMKEKLHRKVFLLLAVMALMVAGSLAGGLMAGSSLAQSGASVPSNIHYHGVLCNPVTGDPVADGGYDFVFSIYNVATKGTPLWTETQLGVEVEDGYFSVLLGSVNPFSASLFDGTTRYLGVKVGTDAEMTPRQHLASVPYAFNAETVDWLDSSDLDDLYVNESGDEMSGSSGDAVLSVTNTGVGGTGVMGTASSLWGAGIYGKATGSGATGWALAGVYGISEVGTYGVYGSSSGTDGHGVYGEATSGWGVEGIHKTTGNKGILGSSSQGVYGQSTSGYGIKGDSTSGHGVYGKSGSGYGVKGESSSDHGVYGQSISGWGVEGINSNTGNHGVLGGAWYGVYGESGGAGSYAAVFRGNVLIRSRTTGLTIIELGEGLDYAEGFDVSNETEIVPGTVLVIDPDNPGELAISDEPYDRKVAGIVSGANGIGSGVRLGTDEFDYDVALAGRVYCNVDATEAAVQPGDLLTTSATPGYAMKATEYERAQGAILGKAMEAMEKGDKGQILVLVTLQ